jgi:hypothetical protein
VNASSSRKTRHCGGATSNFAMARIDRIEPDPKTPVHRYAHLDLLPGGLVPVPFSRGGRFADAVLRALPSALSADPALRIAVYPLA